MVIRFITNKIGCKSFDTSDEETYVLELSPLSILLAASLYVDKRKRKLNDSDSFAKATLDVFKDIETKFIITEILGNR